MNDTNVSASCEDTFTFQLGIFFQKIGGVCSSFWCSTASERTEAQQTFYEIKFGVCKYGIIAIPSKFQIVKFKSIKYIFNNDNQCATTFDATVIEHLNSWQSNDQANI